MRFHLRFKWRWLTNSFLLGLLCFGCQFKTHETQIIEISIYPDSKQNLELAEQIAQYAPAYFMHKILSLNETTGAGIRWGVSQAIIGSNPGIAVYYDTDNRDVARNINMLKREFEQFIKSLAVQHSSKKLLFDELERIGLTWAENLHKDSAEEILNASSERLRKKTNTSQLKNSLQIIRDQYGPPTSTLLLRSQFYESYGSKPEFVSLHYIQTYLENEKALVKITMYQSGENWSVLGFNITDH